MHGKSVLPSFNDIVFPFRGALCKTCFLAKVSVASVVGLPTKEQLDCKCFHLKFPKVLNVKAHNKCGDTCMHVQYIFESKNSALNYC